MIFEDSRLKDLAWFIGLGLMVLVVVLTISSTWEVFGKLGLVSPSDNTQTASLSAQGRAFAAPDTARFTFSIVSRGSTADAVQQANTPKVEAVVNYLKEAGVSAEDIKTVSYNLNPQYRYSEAEGQVLTGYELRETIQVRSKDLKGIGSLVSGAVISGATEVSGVEIFIDDPDAVREQARKEAIAKVDEKKDEMERDLGVKFGRVINVSESDGGYVPPMPYYAEGIAFGRGGAGDVAVAQEAGIEPGSQEVVVTVVVTYQLR